MEASRTPHAGASEPGTQQPLVCQLDALPRADRHFVARPTRAVRPLEHSGAALSPLGIGQGVGSPISGRAGA